MAEFVAERQERVLPEYEQLKKFNICTSENIRECIKKRERFHIRIMHKDRTIRDFVEFIMFEKKMHKYVCDKEKAMEKKLSGLKSSIASRILRLYRDGLKHFPYEERFWMSYIHFCKKSASPKVSRIYEQMLGYHSDKVNVWCDAALWAYECFGNMKMVKEIFIRGLQRHPKSEAINKAFFDILLVHAAKKSSIKDLANDTISEQDMALKSVEVMYRNSQKFITNLNYYLRLLERCEEQKYKCMTARLQKLILDDLMEKFPQNETLWDALAQRELHGFSMSDLRSLGTSEKDEGLNGATEIRSSSSDDIWQMRSAKQRIELCCSVYQTAVTTLKTEQMWTFYINAMLKLNLDMTEEKAIKRKNLAIAFKEGHASGLMSCQHYSIYIRMILELPENLEVAEEILLQAIQMQKSPKLYELWLSIHVESGNEVKVYEIFRKACKELELRDTLPIWYITLEFYKSHSDYKERLQEIYKEACFQTHPDFRVFRAPYLEFYYQMHGIEKARDLYNELCKLSSCLELHEQMASLEALTIGKPDHSIDRWRLCHENATFHFGKTNIKAWLDFLEFERQHGKPSLVSAIYRRAIGTLDEKFSEEFITKYSQQINSYT